MNTTSPVRLALLNLGNSLLLQIKTLGAALAFVIVAACGLLLFASIPATYRVERQKQDVETHRVLDLKPAATIYCVLPYNPLLADYSQSEDAQKNGLSHGGKQYRLVADRSRLYAKRDGGVQGPRETFNCGDGYVPLQLEEM